MEQRNFIQTKCPHCYSYYYLSQVIDDGKDWRNIQRKEPTSYIENKPCPYCKNDKLNAVKFLHDNAGKLIKTKQLVITKEKKYPVMIRFAVNNKNYIYYTDKPLEKGIYKNTYNNTLCELISADEETFFLLSDEQLDFWNTKSKKFSCENITNLLLQQEKELLNQFIDESNIEAFENTYKRINLLLKKNFIDYLNEKRP